MLPRSRPIQLRRAAPDVPRGHQNCPSSEPRVPDATVVPGRPGVVRDSSLRSFCQPVLPAASNSIQMRICFAVLTRITTTGTIQILAKISPTKQGETLANFSRTTFWRHRRPKVAVFRTLRKTVQRVRKSAVRRCLHRRTPQQTEAGGTLVKFSWENPRPQQTAKVAVRLIRHLLPASAEDSRFCRQPHRLSVAGSPTIRPLIGNLPSEAVRRSDLRTKSDDWTNEQPLRLLHRPCR